MKYFVQVVWVVFLLLGCRFQGGYKEQYKDRLTKSELKKVNKSIVEIIVPKKEDARVVYERELPWHQLDFRQREDKYFSIGTAFFISDKRLVSAAHVFGLDDFSTWNEYFVRTIDGKVYSINKIYKYSQYRDYVEFDLKEYPSEYNYLAINYDVEIGDTVFAIGNAQGEGISVRGGQVASFTPEHVDGKWNYIRFSSPASPGNSGGPLVNSRAQVVGVIVMKSESENYNYALPMKEAETLSTDTATFFENNVTVYDGTQTEVEDWKATRPLPAESQQLGEFAQKGKNDFYGKLLDKLKLKKADSLFPKHKMFREYLRNQSLGKYFGIIQNDTALTEWSVEYAPMKKMKVAPKQYIHLAKGKLGHYEVVIEKPENIALKDFIDDSQTHMKILLETMGFTRNIGKERVRILSFGEPDFSKNWTDDLGRKWKSSYWFITYNDVMYVNECQAVPVGVACFFDIRDAKAYSSGYDHFKRYNVLEQPLSYFGTLAQWREFLNLGPDYLPNNFEVLKVSLDKKIHIETKEFDLKLDKSGYSDKSFLTVYNGYAPQVLLQSKILAISLTKDEDEYEGHTLKSIYAPSDLSEREHSKRWKKMLAKKRPYNGKIIESEDIYYSKRAIKFNDEHYYVASCFSDKESEKKTLNAKCLDMSRNLKLKGK